MCARSKDNQPRLFSEVQALFADAMAVGFRGVEHQMNRQVDGGHERVEMRQAWVITDPAHVHYLDPEGTWPNLRSIALVRAERRCGDQVSHDVRYDLSGLAGPRVARILNNAVRAHWGSENSLHWTLRPAGITATCSRSSPADVDAIALTQQPFDGVPPVAQTMLLVGR